MSQNLQALLTTAAEMRAVGHPWESVAKKVHRRVKTCQNWPHKYKALWERLYREAQRKRFDQTGNECHTYLVNLMRAEDPKIQQKAIDSWLRYAGKAYGARGDLVAPGDARPARRRGPRP